MRANSHRYDLSPDHLDHRNRRPSILNDRDDNLLQNSDALGDVAFDDTRNKELSDSLPRNRPGSSVSECDGLEDLPRARRIGNASRRARELYGRADDKLEARASDVAVWIELQSRDSLYALEQLFPLQHRKAAYQPSEGR
jgi:hypothetical protein